MKTITVRQIELLLKYAKKKQGKTQADVAALIGVTQKDISRYKNGEVKMPVDRFFELVEKLGIEDYNMFK